MPQHLLEELGNRIPPRFGASSPNDVFLMVKGFVSDSSLCQSVLAVWPGGWADQSMDALRRIARNDCPSAFDLEVILILLLFEPSRLSQARYRMALPKDNIIY